MSVIKKFLYPFIGVIIIIAAWVIISKAVGVELIVPAPTVVIKSLIKIFKDEEFYSALGLTLLRSLSVFVLVLIPSALAAIVATKFKSFERAFYPLTVIMKAMPTISVILVCLIWFKSGLSPMIVAFIVTFPIAYSLFLSAIKGVDEKIIDMAKVYGVDRKKVVNRYTMRTVVDNAYDGLVTLLSFTIKIVVSAEVLSETSTSIGRLMQISKLYLDTPLLIAYTVVIIVVCFLLEYILKLLKRRLAK